VLEDVGSGSEMASTEACLDQVSMTEDSASLALTGFPDHFRQCTKSSLSNSSKEPAILTSPLSSARDRCVISCSNASNRKENIAQR